MTSTAKIKLLAATLAIAALASMPIPTLAGGKGGGGGGGGLGGLGGALGGVTGAVGGAVSGATGAVGGAVSGVTGAVGGAVNGATSAVGGAVSGVSGALGGTANQVGSITGTQKSYSEKNKALATLKAELLNAKVGIYVLDKKGHLARVDVKFASRALKANAHAYVLGRNGGLARITGTVALAGLLKAQTKVYVLDQRNILNAKALALLGGSKGLKATIGANAGTGGINANVNVSIGGTDGNGGPGGPGTPGNPGGPGTQSGIASRISAMSPGERRELKKRCGSVLASPQRYDSDAVLVCRVLAQLTRL